MEVFKAKTNIDFLRMRWLWMGASGLLMLMAVYLWVSAGEAKYGVDFRGGTELTVHFNKPLAAGVIREAFDKSGFNGAIVQAFESGSSDMSIRLRQDDSNPQSKEKIHSLLTAAAPDGFSILKEDFVGPIIGEQIRRDAIWSIVISLIVILSYVAFRFDFAFGVGALMSLFHDVIITIGFCLLTDREMSAGILAALLTIVGYSVNDTIIVYDRIRENINKALKTGKKKAPAATGKDLMSIMNLSVNETLSRTILTSMTAFFVVTTLWMFGGGAVSDLAFALMVGILVGTYSTIFVACPIVLLFSPKKPKAA